MGRLIFQKKRPSFYPWMAGLVTILLLAIFVTRINDPGIALPLELVLCIFLSVYVVWWFWENGYDLYETGIIIHTYSKKRVYRSEEIDSYSSYEVCQTRLFSRKRTYTYFFTIYFCEETSAKPIRIVFDDTKIAPLEFFHFLNQTIANRMLENLDRNNSTPWTPQTLISFSGVEQNFSSEEFHGGSGVLFSEIHRCSFEEQPMTMWDRSSSGFHLIVQLLFIIISSWTIIVTALFAGTSSRERRRLAFYLPEEKIPQLTVPCDAPNFYPGWEVIKKIIPEKVQ